jgi:hypothetical protein
MTPAWQGMCTRYKFRSVGWRNISVSLFLAEFIAGLLVCIVGITRENKELWVEELVKQMAKSRLVRHSVSGLIKLGELCAKYGFEAWRISYSAASLCWSVVCAARTNGRPPGRQLVQSTDR